MKERPILFSSPMVLAILDGRKTQTRRVIRDAHGQFWDHAGYRPTLDGNGRVYFIDTDTEQRAPYGDYAYRPLCAYGVPSDRLWVRETWSHDAPDLETCRASHEDAMPGIGHGPYYRATEVSPDTLKWRPSIFMPRWASRITLEVTEVRVQRLQQISEDDARAEGVKPFPLDPDGDCWTDGKHVTAYQHLWGEINGWDGPKSWASNPWVWCVSFRRVP